MDKIRWTDHEREILLQQVKKEHIRHPNMPTLDVVRMAQHVVIDANRRRNLTGIHHVKWVQKIRDGWAKENYVPIKDRPIFVEELPPIPPKPDIIAQLTELLSDAIVKLIAEAVVVARAKLDLPVVNLPPIKVQPSSKILKKIAVYGLFSNQVSEVRTQFRECFEFRFLKDVSQDKMLSGARWADIFIVMTKFVSHDYEALKKFGNIKYVNGASSSLITELEEIYLGDCK